MTFKFQSTFPSRGTTRRFGAAPGRLYISIHVPLAGNDPSASRRIYLLNYFNPRSPRGERHMGDYAVHNFRAFQSTFPSRGTTKDIERWGIRKGISIHVPLAGNDRPDSSDTPVIPYFNPRSPRGERLLCPPGLLVPAFHFNPRSPRGERPRRSRRPSGTSPFQSTFPSRGTTR